MKKITTFVVAFCILLASNFVATPKANALVGLIFKSKVVKVIGGIGTGAGVTLSGVGFITAVTAKELGAALLGIIGIYYGLILGGVGLVILDDKTVADIEFLPLNEQAAPQYDAYSIAVYNSEIEELNAIRKSIQIEAADSKGFEKSKALWDAYKVNLSEETVQIAENQAQTFMKELNKAL